MDLVSTIVIGFLSGLTGVASKLGVEALKDVNERRSLAAALSAEIGALLLLIEQRQYVSKTKGVVAYLICGNDMPLKDFIGDPTEWGTFYRNAFDKIGSLGPELSHLVTLFYLQLRSLSVDVKSVAREGVTRAEKIDCLQESLKIAAAMTDEGKRARSLLNDYAEKRPLRHLISSCKRAL